MRYKHILVGGMSVVGVVAMLSGATVTLFDHVARGWAGFWTGVLTIVAAFLVWIILDLLRF